MVEILGEILAIEETSELDVDAVAHEGDGARRVEIEVER
jgi:hypothetical protein